MYLQKRRVFDSLVHEVYYLKSNFTHPNYFLYEHRGMATIDSVINLYIILSIL